MRRAALFMLLLALCVWPAAAAAAPASTVEIIKVDGSIDRTMAGYLTVALDQAERDGSIVVIQLDTAGTLDRSAFVLAQRIFESRVPVIVWVGPAPAKASGAGLLFMYAASLAAVSPGSQTGPLEPLDLAQPSTEIADLESSIQVWLLARRKTTMLPVHDRPLTAAEALDHRIAQVAALSIPDLLNNKINGMTVQSATGPVQLVTRLAEDPSEPEVAWRFHDLGPVGRVLHAMASPSAIYLLLVLGFAALAFELTQPGFGFAGFAGVGCWRSRSTGSRSCRRRGWGSPSSWGDRSCSLSMFDSGGWGRSRLSDSPRSSPVRCSPSATWPRSSISRRG